MVKTTMTALLLVAVWSTQAAADVTCVPEENTVFGDSTDEVMVLCNRYWSPGLADWAQVAVCNNGAITWCDVPDIQGVLTGQVWIRGGGGNDVIFTEERSVSYYLDPVNHACPLSCLGGVDINTHTVDLFGDGGNDVVVSGNDTGLIRFFGGADDDWLQHTGDFDGNVYLGGEGDDTIIDSGGGGPSADSLAGENGADCLETFDGFRVFHCGAGADEWATDDCCVHESCEPEGEVGSCD